MKKLITLSEKVDLLAIAYNLNGGAFVMQEAYELIEYKRFLDQPLTEEMFNGDKAIFGGFNTKEGSYLSKLFEVVFYSDNHLITYSKDRIDDKSKIVSIEVCVIKNKYIVSSKGYVKTLHELAELTKENQLELK